MQWQLLRHFWQERRVEGAVAGNGREGVAEGEIAFIKKRMKVIGSQG